MTPPCPTRGRPRRCLAWVCLPLCCSMYPACGKMRMSLIQYTYPRGAVANKKLCPAGTKCTKPPRGWSGRALPGMKGSQSWTCQEPAAKRGSPRPAYSLPCPPAPTPTHSSLPPLPRASLAHFLPSLSPLLAHFLPSHPRAPTRRACHLPVATDSRSLAQPSAPSSARRTTPRPAPGAPRAR